mmetsp:Transcript_65574/g.168791  ORF Transcript_65574/g.168791 Transcript_65574/m.168791 type:complete len:299 (+) Transcript_65574:988-1884(+)
MPPHGALHAAVHSMENGGESARNAVPVVSNRAEWIEADEALILARAPAMGRHALLVSNQRERIPALDAEGVIQALVKELVLMVIAASTPRTHVLHLQLLRAFAGAHAKRIHRIAREHLQRGVQTELAVVQVTAIVFLRPHLFTRAVQGVEEPGGNEDGVRIHLGRPVMIGKFPVIDDLAPHLLEDRRVQGRHELPPNLAVEIRMHGAGHVSTQLHRYVAVDGSGIASEDAQASGLLHANERPLVAPGQHQGPTEHGEACGGGCGGRGPRSDGRSEFGCGGQGCGGGQGGGRDQGGCGG